MHWVNRIVAIAVVLISASGAYALSPAHVLVVGNANSPDSVELTQFYAQQRGIPPQNVVFVKCTTQQDISREEFDVNIRMPLRQYVFENRLRDIQAICLMWGVPVRVMGPLVDDTKKEILEAAKRSAEKSHNRLAVDYKLLPAVAKKFPPLDGNALKPLGKLFSLPPYDLPNPPPMANLVKDLQELLVQKHDESQRLEDPNQRAIAQRQLMALQLDAFGVGGLLKYVSEKKPAGAPAVDAMQKQLDEANRRFVALTEGETTLQSVQFMLQLADATGGATLEYGVAAALMRRLAPPDADASVDSELALLPTAMHELSGPLDNPIYWRRGANIDAAPVVMTARIDGPTAADARRMIETSLQAEKTGLKGNFYIDAGGKAPQYDELLLQLAGQLTTQGKFPVVLDKKETVMAADTAPDAAMYIGWYSLQKYVPAFKWLPGSVGWHIASWEAQHLRDPNSEEWCVKMIQNGVAATIGATNEPYLHAFPMPQEFFPMLMTGKWTLAECYWRTSPTISWRMTLIGDPLYNPFAASPAFDVKDLPEGMAIPDSPPASRPATAPAGL